MKLRAVHVCPCWEDLQSGERVPLMEPEPPDPGRLVGWVNVLEIRFGDVTRLLLHAGPT